MPKDKPNACDKTVDRDQKDASEVETVDDKTSNNKTSDSNQKVPMVEIVSADGKSFYVEEKVSRRFKFADDKAENTIGGNEFQPVEKIDSNILSIMIKWAEHHVNDPDTVDQIRFMNQKSSDTDDEDDEVRRVDDIHEWDKELLDLDTATLFQLVNAARAVEMAGLYEVLLKKIASMLKGKTADEMREIFCIPKMNKKQLVKKHSEQN